MKSLKALILGTLIFGSLTASANCLPVYKDHITTGTVNAIGGMLFLPIGIHQSYQTHQMQKMKDLINEAKSSRVGKRTRGLYKSLNGQMSVKEIQKVVRANNKWGGFCIKVNDPSGRIFSRSAVKLYRDFKNSLRLSVDKKRFAKGKAPIWTDIEDL